jgi:glycosyltransferase involved in cell wall biosynthesis
MKQRITMAITTYNRPELTIECFKDIASHPRIVEVVIVDDCSTPENFEKLWDYLDEYPSAWMRMNPANVGVLNNKCEAVKFSDTDFVLLADSDNKFSRDYLEALPEKLSLDTIYMPEFAEPNFDFTEFSGLTIDKSNIGEYIDEPLFQVMLNAGNMVVPRQNFIDTFVPNDQIKESDVIWINYNWFKAGFKMYIVPGMRYDHKVHPGSSWLRNAEYNIEKGKEIVELIKQL